MPRRYPAARQCESLSEADIMWIDYDASQEIGASAAEETGGPGPPGEGTARCCFSMAAMRANSVTHCLMEQLELEVRMQRPLFDALRAFATRRRACGQPVGHDELLDAARRELGRVALAIPSLSDCARTRLLAAHGFDHNGAILAAIKSKLEPRIIDAHAGGQALLKLDRAVKVPAAAAPAAVARLRSHSLRVAQRAFRTSVVARSRHPAFEAVKMLNQGL